MKDLTLEMLDAGQQLKAALSHAHRVFGLKDTKELINSWLNTNDKGVSQITTLLTEEEVNNINAEVEAQNDIYMSEEIL